MGVAQRIAHKSKKAWLSAGGLGDEGGKMKGKLYVCEDEKGVRIYLQRVLESWGYQVEGFSNPIFLLKMLENSDAHADLLLLDVMMPEMDGIETLRRVKELRPALPVIIMTGFGTIESAVEAIKLGAYDYLSKPFQDEKLFTLIRNALEQQRLRDENQHLHEKLNHQNMPAAPVFKSEKFGKIYNMAVRVAPSDSNILVLGESGTGKELIAATIHQHSSRRQRRFVAINCAAISETLAESQLFGHVKGAFTGAVSNHKGLLEEADGGTLFLDEVGDLSLPMQAKLLRVLQEGDFLPVGSTQGKTVDVRFVAATNKNLEEEVRKGNFREDLLYRLNVISLQLPPLRERPEDIVVLAEHFLKKMSKKTGKQVGKLSAQAWVALQSYNWPGNVRELENAIERAVILAAEEEITPDLLPIRIAADKTGLLSDDLSYSMRAAERIQVLRALEKTNWNKRQAAILLQIARNTLDNKIREFDLSPEMSGDDEG